MTATGEGNTISIWYEKEAIDDKGENIQFSPEEPDCFDAGGNCSFPVWSKDVWVKDKEERKMGKNARAVISQPRKKIHVCASFSFA